MQPTGGGRLHLGNLEGALRPWVRLQDEYEMFCFIADWHALTTVGEKRLDIAEASRQTAMDYMAAGLDPDKCAIFRQSDVPEHAELHLLLSMVTPVGWLERVPTYKEKRDLVRENDVVGTFFHFLNIANGAHGGGFLLGLSLGYLFFTMRRHWVWAVPLVLLAGVTVFSAVRLA